MSAAMNDSLNPYANLSTPPTRIQYSLSSGASFARFDPSGRLIAAGRPDGTAIIWDTDTRAAVRWLEGHVKGVTSVDWSRNSRYVLTSGKDWNVIIWDLASACDPPQRHATVRFDAPVVSASFHPRNSRILLVLLGTGEAYIVDLRKETRGRVELVEMLDEDDEDENASTRSAMVVAAFEPSGRHVFIGTDAGSVLVFNARAKQMVARHRIAGAGAIKALVFGKNGRRLCTNSTDRVLRQFTLPSYPPPSASLAYIEAQLEPTHRFSDPVNRVAWGAVGYSADGEWLGAGAKGAGRGGVSVWAVGERGGGAFEGDLDGGREVVVDLQWHPKKISSLVATTSHGDVHIWHLPSTERWGAFAGGFVEVDENVIYEEREDEFDIEDESELARRKLKAEEETVDVMSGSSPPADDIDDPFLHEDHGHGWGEEDAEDAAWADAEKEGDGDGDEWHMRVLMEDDGE
ncbi:hypothetical protein PLICRDRAFT_35009 [Plicaturopsis crispa FD-325 SS-3]|nr:hypothetical protein PLICRDRAFT_35009 [Plicaturopsis crispa FD-325 SS-3]